MPEEESNKALTEAADKLAEEASKDGLAAEKPKDERHETEKEA